MALVGQCLGAWSQVDLNMALILGALLKTDNDAAIAVYLVVRRHANQRQAIEGAASVALKDEALQVLQAILAIHKTIDGDRQDLAHGLFGTIAHEPDALTWISLSDHAHFLTNLYRAMSQPKLSYRDVRTALFVYKKSDLQSILTSIIELNDLALRFGWYLRERPSPKGEERFRQLHALPRIQQEISRRLTKPSAQP